jgi:hypothetical protein
MISTKRIFIDSIEFEFDKSEENIIKPENNVKKVIYNPVANKPKSTPDDHDSKTPKPKAPPKKKVMVDTDDWIFTETDLEDQSQLDRLANIWSREDPKTMKFLQFIREKRSGYKSQDQLKNFYDSTKFVSLDHLVELLQLSGLRCFYCKEPVKIVYEYSRDPKQWSLERIENDQGHNTGNLTIACLECNLRRRTMYYERYVMTKNMANVNKIDKEISLRKIMD